MRPNKNAPAAGTAQGTKRGITTTPSHSYYITWLMVVATLLAGWNIEDIWSGVVAGICGVVTVLMTMDLIGGQR